MSRVRCRNAYLLCIVLFLGDNGQYWSIDVWDLLSSSRLSSQFFFPQTMQWIILFRFPFIYATLTGHKSEKKPIREIHLPTFDLLPISSDWSVVLYSHLDYYSVSSIVLSLCFLFLFLPSLNYSQCIASHSSSKCHLFAHSPSMRQTQKRTSPLLEEWSRHIDHVTENFIRGFNGCLWLLHNLIMRFVCLLTTPSALENSHMLWHVFLFDQSLLAKLSFFLSHLLFPLNICLFRCTHMKQHLDIQIQIHAH